VAELPRYNRILFATDGSDSAQKAAGHAVALARQTGATLSVVYVIDTHAAFHLGVYQAEALNELREEGRRALTAVADLAREVGVTIEETLCEGRPGEAIVREAEHQGADLIVVGSHGQNPLADILLGSVSEYVLHHARVPVCIVRPPRAKG
jgi:nucleotide-binding universal stress UspA family protein